VVVGWGCGCVCVVCGVVVGRGVWEWWCGGGWDWGVGFAVGLVVGVVGGGNKTLGLLCFISEFYSSWRAAPFICHTHFHGQLQSQLPLEIRL